MKILLVEDNLELAQSLAGLLRPLYAMFTQVFLEWAWYTEDSNMLLFVLGAADQRGTGPGAR